METLMKEVIFQAPGLAVAAFIVVKFLNYIKARNGSLENIFRDHTRTTGELNKVLQENSKVMGEVVQVITKCKKED